MKGFTVVCLFALCAVALARPDEKYTDKYDHINVKEILTTQRLFESYFNCLMEIEGSRCSAEGKELKSHVKDALGNGCAHCTDIQKERVKEVISFLVNEKPDKWNQLCDKYDKERKYAKKYEDELRKITKN